MSIHELATRMAAYIGREVEADRLQELRMAFGLELILGDIVKLIFILTLAQLLGILQEVLVLMAAAGMLRLASGGEHCSAYYRCLLGGTICFLLLGWLVHYLNPLIAGQAVFVTALLSFLLTEIILWKYAPGDTENKPITEAADKKRFKNWSLLLGFIYFMIMLICAGFNSASAFVLPVAVGMLEQAFTVTPWGYRFMHIVDQVLDFSKWGGKTDGIEDSGR